MFVVSDTNILLRGAQPSHPMQQIALEAQVELKRRGDQPCVLAQNLIEFRAVATRPVAVNGLGMSEADADSEIKRLKSIFPVFFDDPSILFEWEALVSNYGAIGKQNHDARIAAAMVVHGIATIMTFNKSDFVRYQGITVIEPRELVTAPAP